MCDADYEKGESLMRDSLQSNSTFNKNTDSNDFTTLLSALLKNKKNNFNKNYLINALNQITIAHLWAHESLCKLKYRNLKQCIIKPY